jgi:hypothetical protein
MASTDYGTTTLAKRAVATAGDGKSHDKGWDVHFGLGITYMLAGDVGLFGNAFLNLGSAKFKGPTEDSYGPSEKANEFGVQAGINVFLGK